MNPQPQEELDEARLQSLFDRTAQIPGGPMLTKLAARAADIPVRARRRPWWMSLRIAVPASFAMAGALAVIVLPGFKIDEAPPAQPVLLAAPANALPSKVSEPALDEGVTDELEAQLAFDDISGSAIDLGADDAETDAELEAWLMATADLVDEGG